MTEFAFSIDNRFSQVSFLSGLGANLVTHIAMYNRSAFWVFVWKIWPIIVDADVQNIGFYSITYLAYLINFKTPGVACQLELY